MGSSSPRVARFERWVLQVLRAHGYDAVAQVGVCGFRIDIAVRHPAKPGVFLCGIECDGATYHSARSVRERDRLRQEILERLQMETVPHLVHRLVQKSEPPD